MNWQEVFALGAPGFWGLVLLETALLIVLIEWGKGGWATLSLVASLLALHFLGDLNVPGHVRQHPLVVPVAVLAYFALGTLWAIAKWWLYVRDQRARYDELRADFCHEFKVEGAIPERLQQRWLERLQSAAARGRRVEVRPKARQHKGRILTWMSYWHWSLAWTTLNDPVRKLFRLIYHHIHDYLQEISDHAFKGVENDFPGDGPREFPRKSEADAPAA